MYILKQHWFVLAPPRSTPYHLQPWVKGYNGEYISPLNVFGGYLARFWIDQDLKKSMGY